MHVGSMSASGYYVLEKLNSNGEVIETFDFNNLITDVGFNTWINNGLNPNNFSLFISKTSSPVSRTSALPSDAVRFTNDHNRQYGVKDIDGKKYIYYRYTAKSGIGTLSGNYSTLGLYSEDNQLVFSIAKIKNNLEREAIVQILPEEEIRVSYELRVNVLPVKTFSNIDTGLGGILDVTISPAYLNNVEYNGGRLFNKPTNNHPYWSHMKGILSSAVAPDRSGLINLQSTHSNNNGETPISQAIEKNGRTLVKLVYHIPNDWFDSNGIRTLALSMQWCCIYLEFSEKLMRTTTEGESELYVTLYLDVARDS